HIPANALLVSALMGLLANPGFESEARRWVRLPGLKSALTGLTAAASTWMIWLGWRAAPAEIDYEQALSRAVSEDYLGALPYHRRASADPAHYPNLMAFAAAFTRWADEDADLPVLSHDRRRKAVEIYRKALTAYPDNAVAHANLAEQLSYLGPEHAAE